MTILDALDIPIVQAPMAGGAGTPALAAAVCDAGGLGFLAAGYLTAGGLRDEIDQARGLTGRPFGVNMFVPGDLRAGDTAGGVDQRALAAYRQRLLPEAQRYGAPLGEPVGDDDFWDEKLAVLHEQRVAMVSFTFGCPPPEVVAALHEVGSEVAVTVTSAAEATAAEAAGADALVVQGPEAGAHRGTFDNDLRIDDLGLLPLLRRVAAVTELPMMAAGGLADGRDVAAVLVAGATAAQLGTVFLACPESGASSLHKRALTDPGYQGTAVTRAFTGRPARGLVNRFLREHSEAAPAGYPHVHHLTKGLRRAAAAAGDPEAMSLWAGQGHPFAREVPAGELAAALAEQARKAIVDAAERWPRRP